MTAPSAKITVPEVIDRFKAYHKEHLVWGSLHIVLSDFNVTDEDVQWCIEHADKTGDTEGAALGRILLTMSKSQRHKLARTA